jgi:signal transduction histidine kinase
VLARAWRPVAERLLCRTDAPTPDLRRLSALRRRGLAAHANAVAVVDGIVILVWALTGGPFWPAWVMLGLAIPFAIHAWVVLVEERPDLWRDRLPTKTLAIEAGVFATLSATEIVIWLLSGRGTFWPVWSIVAFAAILIVHRAIVGRRGPDREELEERIGVLETTRAGAVDEQESERRRIERDLHDGAQARLVALGMNLGMAEQKLRADPVAAAALVEEARLGVEEALRELRDLARGIHPPVLSDRGLEAAIAALADRSAIPVVVTADVAARPAAPVETAAYFVAAEGLTNAAKHGGASRIDVRIARVADTLVLEVVDDGRGGANPAGSGLAGLRRRVEALDGHLTLTSPPGGPTTLRAELPCGS